MSNTKIHHIKSITELHRFCNLEKPKHPLVSVIDYSKVNIPAGTGSIICDCYSIAIKKGVNFNFKYGQQVYDFDEGVMIFTAPKQVIKLESKESDDENREGWILYIHPDFLWNTPLTKAIKQYEYFNYSVNEALFLSEKEEMLINSLVKNIDEEYRTNIDKFTQGIIISHIESLLNYSERFYQRQFITRKISNHKILDQLEILLNKYFDSEEILTKGLPKVEYLAENLKISQSYLSGLLKNLTGKSTQHHIQDKVIEKAKEKLSTTDLTVSEIAYELGFEFPQSFNKFFKSKTNLSPLEFRETFN
ncbi:helix-turn-helix domain-containing protein [Flavobacterium ajazii]|uniref:helix-turn-helix domain-containing protein n=1 Tax=Flavobacterium ajazii TaxID=2692318 RepID=UPI0013D33194|nr:response regulator transcription factor [Flavobacterium ajazii]